MFEFAYPLRPAHLLAVPFQLVSMFLVFCVIANGLSILAPMAVATGLQKTSQSKGLAIVLNLAFVVVFPLAMVPMLLPLGSEMLLDHLGYVPIVPVALLLTVAQCAIVVALYRLGLRWEGDWLQRRERKVLQLVTVKVD